MAHESAKHKVLPDVVLMLSHRLRRWPNIKKTLGQYLVFAGESAKQWTFQ